LSKIASAAYVVFNFHGKDMTLQLEGRLTAANGYLRFEPRERSFRFVADSPIGAGDGSTKNDWSRRKIAKS